MKVLPLVSEVHKPAVGTPVFPVSEGKFPADKSVHVDKPVVDTPVPVDILADTAPEDKPAEGMMAEDKKVVGMMAEGKPPEGKQAEDKLVADKPVADRLAADKPVEDRPVAVVAEQLVLEEQSVEF